MRRRASRINNEMATAPSESLLPERFVKVPKAFFDSGILVTMKPTTLKVYLDLCFHSNYKTRLSFPNVNRICKETGVHKNAVCRATKDLTIIGLITKKRAPRAFKFKNIYLVIMNPDINLDIYPQNTDKRKPKIRQIDGKWGVRPQNTDSDIRPPFSDSIICPHNTDNKEIERNLNRDSIPIPSLSNIKREQGIRDKAESMKISRETIKTMESLKGPEWVKKEIERLGYEIGE